MFFAFSDNELRDATRALLDIVTQIKRSCGRNMAIVIATSDRQVHASLGGQPVGRNTTFTDLFDGQLADHDFNGIDLFKDPRAEPFRQKLLELEAAMKLYTRRCLGRSVIAIVRPVAVCHSEESPNDASACWRRFDGGPVSEDETDLGLLACINLRPEDLADTT